MTITCSKAVVCDSSQSSSSCCLVTSHMRHTNIAMEDGTPETEYPKLDKQQATLHALKVKSGVDISPVVTQLLPIEHIPDESWSGRRRKSPSQMASPLRGYPNRNHGTRRTHVGYDRADAAIAANKVFKIAKPCCSVHLLHSALNHLRWGSLYRRVQHLQIMASMTMTRVQWRSVVVLLLAVTLVGVQGRLYTNDFTFTDQPQYPYFRRPVPESTGRYESQPDESSPRWASTQSEDVTPGFHDATAETKAAADKFWTPELLARVKAYNDAQDAKYDYTREAQRLKAPVKTATAALGSNAFPKMLDDGTELLWVSEPHATTSPHEMAQLARLMENSAASKPTTLTTAGASSLPEVNHNEVQGSTDDSTVFDVDTSAWRARPWGTKQRPGAEHSLTYVGYGGIDDTHVASTDPSPDHNSP